MRNAIEATNLTRFYGAKRGVLGLNLYIPEGSIVGLLGENGSGKTTAMKLAVGSLVPNSGEIRTLGVDPAKMPPEVRARVGWLSDSLAVPKRFSLRESMELQAAYFPTWDQKFAVALARDFELKPGTIFGNLSLGQKRRFMLTLVLAQKPELLILDEPAGGLDPSVRRQLVDVLLREASERRMTVVLSSHILSDVERLVDWVAFMKGGALVVQDELESLRARVKRLCFSDRSGEMAVSERFRVLQTDEAFGGWRAVVSDFDLGKLQGLEATVEHLNLEELFLVFNAQQPRPYAEAVA